MYNSENDQTKEIDTNVSSKRRSVIAGEEIVLEEEIETPKKEVVNKEKVTENTKKLIDKKIIIGLICVLAVIMSVVIYSVVTKDEEEQGKEGDSNSESHLVVGEKYYYEGLNYTVTKEYLHQIGFFYDYSRNLEGKKIDVSYYKVDGLKDKSLQDKINKILEQEANNLYSEANIQDKNVLYDHIYNCTDVYIFNNVLSTMYCKEFCDVEGNVTYEYKGINIDLNKFEPFDIKQVFTIETKIEDVLSSKALEKYNGENFQYSISPKLVYIPLEDETIEKISLYENKDKVAIYKRYANDTKMFDVTFKAIPYAYTTKKFIETDSYGLVEDNLFIDTCNLVIGTEYSDGLKEAAKDLYTDVVNKLKNISYSNPSKRYLAQITAKIEEGKDEVYNIIVKYDIYEIEKEFFNKNIIEFVVASENKEKEEYSSPDYFTDPVMDAEQYLKDTQSDILEKQVDKDGQEIVEKVEEPTQNNIGIS
ncbi:MAG: hypothetical protein J6A15_06890 [Clostridia bacterium]|nr:hypothetical protein [Clostridia bacterium]